MLRSLFRPLSRLFRRIWRPYRRLAARRGRDVDAVVDQIAREAAAAERTRLVSTPTIRRENEAAYRSIFDGTPDEAAENLCALPANPACDCPVAADPIGIKITFAEVEEAPDCCFQADTIGELVDRFGADAILVYRDPATGRYRDAEIVQISGVTFPVCPKPLTLGTLADAVGDRWSISLHDQRTGERFPVRVVEHLVGPPDERGLRSHHPIGRTALEII